MATKTTKKTAAAPEAAVEPKKTVKKAAAAKAETVKTEPAKAEAGKKEVSAPSTAVVFEFADKKVVAKELLEKAKASFAAAHKDVVVEEMNLYINANDGFAYLVVNGTEYPEDKIEL